MKYIKNNIAVIKKVMFLMLTTCFVFSAYGQSEIKNNAYRIIRSSLGIGGASKSILTSKGQYTLRQSIGQTSVIGTHINNGYYLIQGYQQSVNTKKTIQKSSHNNLEARVYPNPFDTKVHIAFKDAMTKDVSVLVYDVSGKLIYSKAFSPSKYIELDLKHFSTGTYFLKALSNEKLFNAKLIKI